MGCRARYDNRQYTGTTYTLTKGFLKPQKTYKYTITEDDGKKFTTSNTGQFNTRIVTGINDIILNTAILIYPNPATNEITVEYTLTRSLKIGICLYNLGGKNLIRQSLEEYAGPQSHRINLTSIGKGIFILKLVTNDSGQESLIKTFKLIKN